MRRVSRLLWYWNRIKTYIGRPRIVIQTRAVVIEDNKLCETPIFIVGPHRSGTSLLRRLFNSHPDIACPPESFFMTDYVNMLEDHKAIAGYGGFGYTANDMREDLMRKASSLHEAFRIANGKRIWADKTPEYSVRLEGIDRLFGGKPRYLIVSRHPGDVVHSIYRRDWRFNDIGDGFESAVAYVKHCMEKLDAFAEENPNRCAKITYCELCRKPEEVLTAAMSKLGLSFHPEMLNFVEKDHNFGLEDPVIHGTKGISAQSGAWRSLDASQRKRILDVFGDRIAANPHWSATSEG